MSNQQQAYIPIRAVPQGRLGMWILIAGELVIFGGLVGIYLIYRLRYPEWAEQAAHTSTFFGALNTVVLLSSSYTIVRAHKAAVEKNIKQITTWMSLTMLGGLMFLINKSIEYTHEISHGMTMSSPKLQAKGEQVGSLFWSFYYTMTGLHATHVIVGMIIMAITLRQVRKGKNLHRVELAGIYWHMVDLIWIFLFPLLYIAK